MTNTKELTKNEPSKRLQGAILNMIRSFQKTSLSIDRVFSIGREEGFNDVEIGNMVRKEMLAAGYNPRTMRRVLPLTSKQIQKTRKDYSDEDILSSLAHKNEVRAQSAQESDNDMIIGTTNSVRDAEFVPNVPDLSAREPHQGSAWQVSETEERSDQLTAEQPQQTVLGIEKNSIIFGLARISILPEDNELLKFEFPIPKDIFWQYVEDHLGEDHDNQFWINGIMNQETGKILSLAFGRSGIS
jgi:hypothetical protein